MCTAENKISFMKVECRSIQISAVQTGVMILQTGFKLKYNIHNKTHFNTFKFQVSSSTFKLVP